MNNAMNNAPNESPPRPSGYDELRQTLAWVDLGPRSVLTARGPDAVRFIDGFTTAAVAGLSVGSGTEGFFTDGRGWVLALTTILRTEDGLWIDAAPGLAAGLREHLEHYHIRERMELADESCSRTAVLVAGPQAAAWLAKGFSVPPPVGLFDHVQGCLGTVPVAVVRIDWCGPTGFLLQAAADDHGRLIAWLESESIPRAEPAAVEAARIEAGRPEPADIPEKTLPQELERNARAISFTKGCYLGQETVARIDALGHVNRRLVALACDGPREPAVGALVRAGDEVIGRLTSACFSPALGCGLGLGILQARAVDAADTLSVNGVTARVVAVPLEVLKAVRPSAADAASRHDGMALEDDSAETGTLLLETKRFRVVRVTEPCADGSRREREVVRHPGSVVVVPLVSPREVCLVEVVRVAVGKTLWELPAGTLDRIESLAAAAQRELAEETGYRAGRITPAGSFWMSPGILRERMHLFIAEDLTPGPQALEPGEQIRSHVVAWDEAIAMCLDGRIDDAKTIVGLLLIDARRR
ncbi:MAG: NUDIX domain-containing protein [Planctomycetes bacterium]|nr:NUDIX domain-containing protein [Planctomycetota bacterium]